MVWMVRFDCESCLNSFLFLDFLCCLDLDSMQTGPGLYEFVVSCRPVQAGHGYMHDKIITRNTALRLYASANQSSCSLHPCLSRLIIFVEKTLN